MKRGSMLLAAVLVALLMAWLAARTSLYTVSERETAVILEFGRPVASRTEPGLYVKMPFIQEVHTLPKTLRFWSGTGDDTLEDLPTADGKKIDVDVWAVWRITDPVQFVEVLRTVENGESRVKQFVRSVARDTITGYSLAEVVRSTDRKLTYTLLDDADFDAADAGAPDMLAEVQEELSRGATEKIEMGRKKIVDEIKAAVQERLADKESHGRPAVAGETGRGIELVDLGLSRIDFVPEVREAAFNRQIALMESIAARYTNEGERRRQEILNRTQAEVRRIEGEGQQEANVLRGKVDAEITDAYAAAMDEAGEYFFFYRTLEAYSTALSGRTRLILTTDSELFRLLKGADALPEVSEAAAVREAELETAGRAEGE